MAIKGLSKPILGKYTNSSGTVTYSEGKTIGHAISYSAEIEMGDNNPLYGDNEIVENDKGIFQSGTLTLNTSELTNTVSKWLLGLTTNTYTIGEGTGATEVTETVFDDQAAPITVGFGIIELHQVNDTDSYRTVILTKCVPKIPADAANTKGETIEWQTQEITFDIQKDDTTHHMWKIEAEFTSEAAALAYLQARLGVANG